MENVYHKDIVVYYSSNSEGEIIEKKVFNNSEEISDYFQKKHFKNRIVVLDCANNKVVIDTNLINKLKEVGILKEKIPFFTSPNIPYYFNSLISNHGGFENYLYNVTLSEIHDHYREHYNPIYRDHVVYPLMGKVTTITPDKFILKIESGERISIKRKKSMNINVNDYVCVLTVLNDKGILYYSSTMCNITKGEFDTDLNEFFVLGNKFSNSKL